MHYRQRVTVLDVAALAGVHAATVPCALSRPAKVVAGTRKRVKDAVRDLRFAPNRAARGLSTGRTENIAVILPDVTNPPLAALVRSVQRTAHRTFDRHCRTSPPCLATSDAAARAALVAL